ncbi:amidase [Leekyejoonella antrihumi]|uniref:Asp-tRNA(Asn)/Glu-tRNA(Gln) amidotransferase GatCAB subunit A n=1 Tax=Leekyejoonella antrihumi TaxID=1660198 RepID=A0A563E892_9MICO|nr:amidase [Leekyejoonella antrihumi]TWP38529.1 Asp-tRNA(Asn)/Glu-tRNA(Gln) amidotransferase GatCAB subunit A [Leekyejoonella antrihumi]
MEPYELTLAAASSAIAAGDLSSVELTESVIGQIERHEAKVCAFATLTLEQAREAARQADADIAGAGPRTPLHGIPLGIKDLCDTEGVLSTSSSRTREGRIGSADSAVTARLRGAGGVLLGQTHTHEFAYGVLTPTTHNPWDLSRTPGGSSGGNGAALAARMIMGAVGTDTGGSIRIPSSVNGMAGLKPTFGRVSRRGITPLSWSLDHAGPMARTVTDVALLLQALAGYDPSDPGTADVPVPHYADSLGGDLAGQTLAVPSNWFFDRIEPDVEAAFRSAVSALEAAGATIREVTLPLTETYMAVEYALFTAEASSYHQEALRTKADLFEPDVRALLEAGELVYATDYIRALRARELIKQGWREMFEMDGIDALLAPTLPATAVKTNDPVVHWPDGTDESAIDAYVRASAPGNLTGLPALSVPCGFDRQGLPIGMQIIGRPFDEPGVLRIGSVFEAATDFANRMPGLV